MVDNKTLEFDTSYDNLDVEEVIINGESEVIKADEVTPFDVIRKMAEGLGQTINEPKANCKECYGRGYIGRDSESKAPIPCRCIYNDFDSAQNTAMYNKTRPVSRAQRRQMERNFKKQMKKMKRSMS